MLIEPGMQAEVKQ